MSDIVYRALSIEQQHDMLARTLISQERDHYIHSINQQRYEIMLAEAQPEEIESPWYTQIANLLSETKSRKHEVESIILALENQLPQEYLLQQAIQRVFLEESERRTK